MSNYLIKHFPDYYGILVRGIYMDRTGGDPITQGNKILCLYKNIGADEQNWISCS